MAEIIQIDERTWRIEDGFVRFFLLCGTERAVLMDTGDSTKNAREIAESLTSLPLMLLNTHADPDHIAGNDAFDAAFMSPDEEANYRFKGGTGQILPVREGDMFDLGERLLRIYDIPGHTPGSIAVLDEGARVLYTGDTISDDVIMMSGPYRNMPLYIKSLKKLTGMTDLFDMIYPCHGSFPMPLEQIEKQLAAAEEVESGKKEGVKSAFMNSPILEYRFPFVCYLGDRDIGDSLKELTSLQKKMAAYEHAVGLISYDGMTGAPKETAANRGVSMGVLTEELYRLGTADETVWLLKFLDAHKDELPEKERRMVWLLYKDIREMQKIPMEEYVAYQELLVEADDVWHRAKEASDFELFRPYLEKIFDTVRKFALYVEPDKDPYDHCLSEYEEGLSKETLDAFFGELRAQIVPLLQEISGKPQVDDSIRFGAFPEDKQRELALWLMETIGLDLGHVGLATTEHPFTTSLGSHLDERITTRFVPDDFVCSLYSVVHEGGHALYDTGSADDLAYTVLDGGTSMSIHESQSRFYENILGRSRAFCAYIFPKLCELFPEQMAGRTAEELYRAVNKAQPSLIRTEADELTYCLHVMVRYELEKRVIAGELEVKDLPGEWNRLYQEYLGIEVPDDRSGVLQDCHWSGGLIGYFPSYALGSAYGAQFLAKMKESVDVDACVAKGDFGPVNDWNREQIWKHGSLYTPAQILERVLGEPFDPGYYVQYLREKFHEIYG